MPPDDQEVSLRDTINAAVTQAENDATPPPPTEGDKTPPPPTDETPPPEGDKTPPPTEEDKTPPPEGDKTPTRGKDGRFQKKADGAPPPTEDDKTPPPDKKLDDKPPPTDAKTPTSRAPGTWTPAAREKWNTLPAEVQKEVLRRERDITNGFTEVGRIRQFGQSMHDLWAPFHGIIAAEGGDAMKMTRDLFVTAASLYNGTPEAKATTVANLIKSFGVDVATLDNILAGQMKGEPSNPAANVDQAVRAAVQREMAPFHQQQQQTQNQMVNDVNSEIDAFAADPKNEWFADVKDTMADLLEVAAKQGKQMDLQTAYQRAIMMHEDIAEVMQERSAKEKAAAASQVAAAAKKKAVSVTGAPAQTSSGFSETSSLRDDIVSAFEQHST